MTLRRRGGPGECDARTQGARIAALGNRGTPQHAAQDVPTTQGFISVRVPRLPRLVLLVLGSAIFGFFARRRWWLVLIPIAIGASSVRPSTLQAGSSLPQRGQPAWR